MLTDVVPTHGVKALLLVWQNPGTRRFTKVARLQSVGDSYRFEYLDGATDPDFAALHSFPDKERVYVTGQLPAFFQNRLMSKRRDSYAQYTSWLGLNPEGASPMEVLARTGGGRATDTFYVVEEPELRTGERTILRFFSSGLSHVDGALGRLLLVRPGDILTIRPEPHNPANQRALLIDASAGESVGWVPDWLLDEVHELVAARDFQLEVERVNLDAPWHLKLMCRLEATCVSSN